MTSERDAALSAMVATVLRMTPSVLAAAVTFADSHLSALPAQFDYAQVLVLGATCKELWIDEWLEIGRAHV